MQSQAIWSYVTVQNVVHKQQYEKGFYWHSCCNSVMCFQVSVDVFKGFPDEDSIVNYTLNQAYQDNVSVFASESSFCVMP